MLKEVLNNLNKLAPPLPTKKLDRIITGEILTEIKYCLDEYGDKYAGKKDILSKLKDKKGEIYNRVLKKAKTSPVRVDYFDKRYGGDLFRLATSVDFTRDVPTLKKWVIKKIKSNNIK